MSADDDRRDRLGRRARELYLRAAMIAETGSATPPPRPVRPWEALPEPHRERYRVLGELLAREPWAGPEEPGAAEPVLCYVEDGVAHFTTCELARQWGDDWDDAPYECNAGAPSDWAPYHEVPPYRLVEVAYRAPLVTPDHDLVNSPYAVRDINARAVPWLRTEFGDPAVAIWAGTPLSEFRRLVRAAGGHTFTRDRADDEG